MPAFSDGLWWDINGYEMAVWLATAVCLLGMLILLLRRLRHRGDPSRHVVGDTMCIYLDDRSIMDVYQLNRYAEALRQEVEHRVSRSGGAEFTVPMLSSLTSKADVRHSSEVVTKYIDTHEPISVVQVLIDGLSRSNAVVTADLRQRTVDRDAALRLALTGRSDSRTLRLSDISGRFVLLSGSFTRDATASSGGHVTFTAPYGDHPSAARVRLRCREEGLRLEQSDKRPRVCLGVVIGWVAEDAVLDVQPLAVFS
ncbi:hypothetical protein AB0E62_34730 [Streptomyces sp. NPDC038707]